MPQVLRPSILFWTALVVLAGLGCSAPASARADAPQGGGAVGGGGVTGGTPPGGEAGSTEVARRTPAGKPSVKKGPAYLPGFPSQTFWLLDANGEGVPLISAHRGRPEIDGYPENCLESLQRLLQEGSFIAEIDINISSDGVLFLFHDDDLARLTRNKGLARERTWAELDTMRLLDPAGRLTAYTIPSLDEALELAKGKGLLSLDRKRPVTLRQISNAAKKRGMLAEVSLILYNLEDYREWAEMPELGPMSFEALDIVKVEELAQRNRELYARFGVSPFRENGTRPTSGFLGVGTPNQQMLNTARALRIRATVGTFGALDRQAAEDGGDTYRALIASGVSVLATNRPLAASVAIYSKGGRS